MRFTNNFKMLFITGRRVCECITSRNKIDQPLVVYIIVMLRYYVHFIVAKKDGNFLTLNAKMRLLKRLGL